MVINAGIVGRPARGEREGGQTETDRDRHNGEEESAVLKCLMSVQKWFSCQGTSS